MLQTVRTEKVDEKKLGHLSSFHVSLMSYGLQIDQKSAFFTILCWTQQEIYLC